MGSNSGTRQRLLEILAAALFLTQLIHLTWMSTYVVPIRIWGISLWSPPAAPLALADYLELPAIVTTSLLYIRTRNWKMLTLVNLQLFHIFWITDEFVLNRGSLEPWLAWIAITIDYLELPVIFDTIGRVIRSTLGRRESVPASRSG
jgi:hypothetical protein